MVGCEFRHDYRTQDALGLKPEREDVEVKNNKKDLIKTFIGEHVYMRLCTYINETFKCCS